MVSWKQSLQFILRQNHLEGLRTEGQITLAESYTTFSKTRSNSTIVLSSLSLLSLCLFLSLLSSLPLPYISLLSLSLCPLPHPQKQLTSTGQTVLSMSCYFLLPQWSYVHRLSTLSLHQSSVYTQPSFLRKDLELLQTQVL